MTFGERLKQLRESKELSQRELARLLNIGTSTLGMYETNKREPDFKTITKLADFFGVSVDYLLGRTDDPRPLEKILPHAIPYDHTKQRRVPIYGEVRAGDPMFLNSEFLGYAYVDERELRNGDYFLLLVRGDSMVGAYICDRSLVLVRKQNYLDNGDIGVVIVNDEEATVKRYYRQNGLVILKPENPAYQPQVYKPEEVTILGKVVQIRINI